jgi:galactokinase
MLDCRSLDYEVISKPADWSFVILDSRASRALTTSAYAQRVKECEAIARQTGVTLLRDLQAEHLVLLEGDLLKRARHIFSENKRVLDAAVAMRAADRVAFGELMNASHQSLKDDYEVSSAALDELVAHARAHVGCLGSRLTGAGFGGCTVSLVAKEHQNNFVEVFSERVVTYL